MKLIRLLSLVILFAFAQITIAAHAMDGQLHADKEDQRFCAACNTSATLDTAPPTTPFLPKHIEEFGAPVFASVAALLSDLPNAPYLARDPPSHI
jgi:hypothetical protein